MIYVLSSGAIAAYLLRFMFFCCQVLNFLLSLAIIFLQFRCFPQFLSLRTALEFVIHSISYTSKATDVMQSNVAWASEILNRLYKISHKLMLPQCLYN
jgi:hypothetical protein